MALEPYQRRIAVQTPQGSDVRLRENADIGPAFGNLSKTLLNIAEPYLKERAETAAVEAAGVATIVKDPETGAFIRPPPPPGGGLVYQQVYNRAMDQRYSEQVIKTSEGVFDTLARQFRNDPDGYKQAMEAHWRGTMAGVDPRVRAEVDIAMSREMGERFRGANSQFIARRDQATVNGIQQSIEYNGKLIDELNRLPINTPEEYADQQARIGIHLEAQKEGLRQLVELGYIDEVSQAASTGEMTLAASHAQSQMQSMTAIAQIGPVVQQMTDEDLRQGINLMLTGGSTLEKVGPLTTENWLTTINDPEQRQRAAQVFSRELQHRDSVKAAAAKATQEAALADYDTQALMLARQVGHLGNLPGDAGKALERDFLKNGPPAVQMVTPEGRAGVTQWINTYGHLSPDLIKYLDTAIMTEGQSENVYGFINDLRTTRMNGVPIGDRLLRSLSKQTQALVELDYSARHGLMSNLERQAIVERAGKEAIPTMAEARAAYAAHPLEGETYDQAKARTMAEHLGNYPGVIANAIPMGEDYDNLYRVNLQLFAGNTERALQATASAVAKGWQVSAIFLGGYGPRELLGSGIEMQDLSRVFQEDRVHNPGVATFSGNNGQFLRLHPLEDMTVKGYGDYEVSVWRGDPAGGPATRLSVWRVSMDGVMRRAWGWNQVRTGADANEAMRNAEYTARIYRTGEFRTLGAN